MSKVRPLYCEWFTTARTRTPAVNAASVRMPNHSPNCEESVNARHTRDRGAFRNTCRSMRSDVAVVVMQPLDCILPSGRRKSDSEICSIVPVNGLIWAQQCSVLHEGGTEARHALCSISWQE